jgi:hypothetical protein
MKLKKEVITRTYEIPLDEVLDFARVQHAIQAALDTMPAWTYIHHSMNYETMRVEFTVRHTSD